MALLFRLRREVRGPRSGGWHRDARAHIEHHSYWRAVWRDAAIGCELHREVSVPAGTTESTPRLLAVGGHARRLVLTVEMLPGQLVEDYAAVADRLAIALGTRIVVPSTDGANRVALELCADDPLAEGWTPTLLTLDTVRQPAVLFRGAAGTSIGHSFADAAHVAVQGQNGSGKSVFTYALLAQLAGARDVVIGGSDITGLVLGRPWEATSHRSWQAAGTSDLALHAAVLEAHVAEMDRRLADMPTRVDKLTPSPDLPLHLVVIEETPGLLRAAEALGKPGRGEGRPVADRIRTALLRLLSEGRKVAFRVVMLAQRFEATAVGGGYAREQLALTVSFRVPAESLVMLHGDDARELGAAHRTAEPGIAVLSAPGRPLQRVRGPYLPDEYAGYVDRIADTAR